MENKTALVIDKVDKSFSVKTGKKSEVGLLQVLRAISMSVMEGEIIGLLGPSGCGKSTLLNIVAGFDQPDKGEVLFQGEPVIIPSPERGVLFQSAVLFPWFTVKENIVYGLRNRRENQERIEIKYRQYIELVGLKGFDGYYPNQLSGGMQQRAALARALIMGPRMLLMDEPFAALDAQTRMLMQQLLLGISEQIKPTILFITHDIEEALILSDRVLVMSKLPGEIIYEVTVPFSRPRDLSMIGSYGFAKMKDEIRQYLFNQLL